MGEREEEYFIAWGGKPIDGVEDQFVDDEARLYRGANGGRGGICRIQSVVPVQLPADAGGEGHLLRDVTNGLRPRFRHQDGDFCRAPFGRRKDTGVPGADTFV